MPYFVAFFMLLGVAFSNSSMTKRSDFRWPPLFLEGNFSSSFFKFKLTRTLTIFGDCGILADIP